MAKDSLSEVDYECANCHFVFRAPITHFDGFIRAVRIAASMGRIKAGSGKDFDITKVPMVSACCPDCFQHFQ